MRCVWLRDHSLHMLEEDETPGIVIVDGKVRIHLRLSSSEKDTEREVSRR